MDTPSSTPFPLLTFQSSASTDSPAALRDFLLQTIADNQPSLPYRIKNPHLETWIPILSGLSDYVLSSFPSISTGTWDILHEKAVLVNATVDVFHLFLQKYSNLFDTTSLVARKALVRLIILCHVLDCRNDGDVSINDGIPSPKELREKCLAVATEVMRYLGDSLGSGNVENSTWEAFRSVYVGLLGIGEGERHRFSFLLLFIILAMVLEEATLAFPLELLPFQGPHIKEISSIPDKVCRVLNDSVVFYDDFNVSAVQHTRSAIFLRPGPCRGCQFALPLFRYADSVDVSTSFLAATAYRPRTSFDKADAVCVRLMSFWDFAYPVRVTGSLSYSNLFCRKTTPRVAKCSLAEDRFYGHGSSLVAPSIRQSLYAGGRRDVTRPAE